MSDDHVDQLELLRKQAREAVAVLTEGAKAVVDHVASTLGVKSDDLTNHMQLQFPGIMTPAEAAEQAQEVLSRMGPPRLLIDPGAVAGVAKLTDMQWGGPGASPLATDKELREADNPKALLRRRQEALQRAVDGKRYTGPPPGPPDFRWEETVGLRSRAFGDTEGEGHRYVRMSFVVSTYGTEEQAEEAAKRARRHLSSSFHQPVIWYVPPHEVPLVVAQDDAVAQGCSCWITATKEHGPKKDRHCRVHGIYARPS